MEKRSKPTKIEKNNRFKTLIKESIDFELAKNLGKPILSKLDTLLMELPPLKKAVELLLTSKYRFYVKDIDNISPSSYRVTLRNEYDFILIYGDDKIFTTRIRGKHYDLGVAGEAQRAKKAIDQLCTFTSKPTVQNTESMAGGVDPATGGMMGGGGDLGGPSVGTFEPLDGNSANPMDDPDGEEK